VPGATNDTVVLIAAITGLITAFTLFGGFVLSVLTFIRQGRRDAVLAEIHMGVNGLSHEAKASALGQATAEAKVAHLEGEKEGIASERAAPMTPAGQ
jgi:hypothetical protein